MQQLQALWLQSSRPEAHPGDIAARAAEARHETAFDWIAAADEHDRYGRGGSAGHAHGDIWADDHGHLPLRQIRRECRQPIDLVLRPADFDCDVVAVDEPGFLQAVTECRYPVSCIGRGRGIKETDHRYRRSLCARRERPRGCCAAEQRDELAPFPLMEMHLTLSEPGTALGY